MDFFRSGYRGLVIIEYPDANSTEVTDAEYAARFCRTGTYGPIPCEIPIPEYTSSFK